MKLYEVEFAAKITVAANSQREALHLAYDIIDNPHCYPTYVHTSFAYPEPLDTSTLDEPSPITRTAAAPLAQVDDYPIPF
jgi:hypothetical protein